MPWNDGIPKINSYSLTDFHDFDFCPFRFFVYHHLGKKYELSESSPSLALGSLLDESIKLFHRAKAYGCEPDYLGNIVEAALNFIKEKVAKGGEFSFHGKHIPYLNDQAVKGATKIFKDYYLAKDKKINRSLGEVGFCEWIIKGDPSTGSGQVYKLWGGPDALEEGDDGIPEVVDYKSREALAFNSELNDNSTDEVQNYKSREGSKKAKLNLDMDLMPKIYTLLVSRKLVDKGYSKARFKVRIWQDPLNESFFEEFDLETIENAQVLFKQKIDKILSTQDLRFCEKDFCRACKSDKRDEFLIELQKMGLRYEI